MAIKIRLTLEDFGALLAWNTGIDLFNPQERRPLGFRKLVKAASRTFARGRKGVKVAITKKEARAIYLWYLWLHKKYPKWQKPKWFLKLVEMLKPYVMKGRRTNHVRAYRKPLSH